MSQAEVEVIGPTITTIPVSFLTKGLMLSLYTAKSKRPPSSVLPLGRSLFQISRTHRTPLDRPGRLKISLSIQPKTLTRHTNNMADNLREDAQDASSLLEMEEKAQSSASKGRGGRGRGKGRGGGGQGREVQVSKALSKLLRHQAGNAGIQLDDEGYAPLNSVVSETEEDDR